MRALTWNDLGEQFDGPHATPLRTNEGPYFLNIASLDSGRLDLSKSDRVSEEQYDHWTRRVTPQGGDLLFSYETRIGEAALMPDGLRACLGRRMALLRPNPAVVYGPFLLYYYLSPGFQRTIAERTVHGATVPRILLSEMPTWPVELPNLDQQRAIAEVLGALDDKIAANERLIATANRLSTALFDQAVIGGRQQQALAEVAQFHNRRRIPLSARQRQDRRGSVPYYGAAGLLDHVDEALFDDRLALVGEDGSVVKEDGSPVLQYVWGPSWVNNHAHVLTGRQVSTELLHLALQRTNVTALVTGAVQPKINMGNLKALVLVLPVKSRLPELEARVEAIFGLLRGRTDETRLLAQTRDELLPLLMSGKVTVKDAEKQIEEVV